MHANHMHYKIRDLTGHVRVSGHKYTVLVWLNTSYTIKIRSLIKIYKMCGLCNYRHQWVAYVISHLLDNYLIDTCRT